MEYKLDSLYFTRQFVMERHKYAQKWQNGISIPFANLTFASPRRENAPEWR